MFGHDTSDCYVPQRRKQPNGLANTSSSSSGTSFTPSGAPSSGPSPATKSKSHVTCYNCNQKGHYSNECPLPKKKPPALLNSLDDSTPTPPAQPSGDSLSTLHTNDLYEEYNRAINKLQADSLFQLNTSDNSSFSKICVPALVNNHLVFTFLDTGASCSFIDLETAKKFHVQFHLLKSSITLGANNSVAEVHGVVLSILVACGKLHFRHHFRILSLSQSETVIFSHDMLKKLDFEISGIPINFPSASPSPPVDSNVMTPEQYREKSLPPFKQQYIVNAIQDLLDVNQQLPVGPSSHQAVLHLNTNNHRPIFRHQYPLPRYSEPTAFNSPWSIL
ncbi:hypothetical protein QOT17_008512 [Balamuthia mandrillaris]